MHNQHFSALVRDAKKNFDLPSLVKVFEQDGYPQMFPVNKKILNYLSPVGVAIKSLIVGLGDCLFGPIMDV